MMLRFLLILLLVAAWPIAEVTTTDILSPQAASNHCSPNPNDQGPPHFVDGCPLTALGLNKTAPVNSPTFTGVPTAPTAPSSSNDNTLATTSFVKQNGGGGGGFPGNLTGSCTLNGSVITCNLAGSPLQNYGIQGNTMTLASVSGTFTPGDLVGIGPNGQLVDSGSVSNTTNFLTLSTGDPITLNSGFPLGCNTC